MAEKIRYTCQEPGRLLFSSVTQKSAPRNVPNATPKYSAIVGIGKKDLDAIEPLMVQCIQSETGVFTGNLDDYHLSCTSGKTAAARVRAKAELDCMGKSSDEAFKIKEKAEKRAALYETFAGILNASSQFEVELARLDAGKIVDIKEEHQRAQAGKDLFYSGAYVVPAVSFQGYRRKLIDTKDGVTGFLQNMLFIRKGEKLDLGGSGANNQDVFGGFANYSDYDPTAMAPGGGNEFSGFASGGQAGNAASGPGAPGTPATSPASPPAGLNRPQDPAWRHDNGNGTEQWWNGSAWDGGAHPVPAAAPPPAVLNQPPAPGAGIPAGQPAW